METSKNPTLSGSEAVLMVGNIDEETSPQSQQPENSSTQDGSSEELSVCNPQEQKRVLHYYSRLARAFIFPVSQHLPPSPQSTRQRSQFHSQYNQHLHHGIYSFSRYCPNIYWKHFRQKWAPAGVYDPLCDLFRCEYWTRGRTVTRRC
jgi:hypothetical protein